MNSSHSTVSLKAKSRAREFALQALYQYLLNGEDVVSIDLFTRDLRGFHKADLAHYETLVQGCIQEHAQLDEHIEKALDRKLDELSPIEHAVLWIGLYEFIHCLETPYRVILNECIELAKSFGGSDGHKYVNGVLHRLSLTFRTIESSS